MMVPCPTQSCYMWVAAVGLELLLYASEHFEEQFMSSDELNYIFKQNKLSSLYVWSRQVRGSPLSDPTMSSRHDAYVHASSHRAAL
eukprot:27272-Eustigmatos_ZCMA.PRE.1